MTAGVALTVSGRMKGKRASGTLNASVALIDDQGNDQGSCDTGIVKWRASRAPGRIFGGKTAQDQPVVVQLDRARRKVSDLMFGWGSETCTPPDYLTTTSFLGNFPVTARRFGDTFTDDNTLDDGSKQTVGYDIAGWLKGRSASGSLRITVTNVDPAGTQTLTCDTGAVSWRALTG